MLWGRPRIILAEISLKWIKLYEYSNEQVIFFFSQWPADGKRAARQSKHGGGSWRWLFSFFGQSTESEVNFVQLADSSLQLLSRASVHNISDDSYWYCTSSFHYFSTPFKGNNTMSSAGPQKKKWMANQNSSTQHPGQCAWMNPNFQRETLLTSNSPPFCFSRNSSNLLSLKK